MHSFCDEQCPVDLRNDKFISICVLLACSAQLRGVRISCIADIFPGLPASPCSRLFYFFVKSMQEVAKFLEVPFLEYKLISFQEFISPRGMSDGSFILTSGVLCRYKYLDGNLSRKITD